MGTVRIPNIDEKGNFTDPEVLLRLQEAIGSPTGGASGTALAVDDAVGEYAWNYPMAMYRATPAPRTYFGATDAAGNLLACYFDHGTGKSRRQVIGTSSVVDDHHIPTASVPEGAPQLWVWNNHNRDAVISYRVGDRTGDLETLGPVRTVTAGGTVSYAAIIRNPGDPLEVWMLNRTWPTSSPYDWSIRRGVIDEAALSVAWEARRTFIAFPTDPTVQGYVTVAPVSYDNGDYGFRFAATGNPTNGDFHDVLYGSVNLTTGAVESPGKVLTANVRTGAGLPLSVDDLAVIYTPPAGNTTRLFGVRDAGAPAVAVATWDPSTAGSQVEYFHVSDRGETVPGTGLTLTNSGDYASAPAPAALQSPGSRSFRIHLTPSATLASKALFRRYATAGKYVFQASVLSTNKLRFALYPTGAATPNVVADSSAAMVYTVGEPLSIRIDVDTTANIVRYYTSTDGGTTWAQLGADVTMSGDGEFFASDEPIYIGAQSGGLLGTVTRFSVRSLDGATTHLTQDFTTNATGWTAHGGATMDPGVEGGVLTESLGQAGVPFGMATSSRYVGGLAYPTPSKGELLYRAREAEGVHYLEKVSKASGTWTVRALDQSATHALARPMPIEGQGPLETIYSAFSHYAGYTDFQGDYRGV